MSTQSRFTKIGLDPSMQRPIPNIISFPLVVFFSLHPLACFLAKFFRVCPVFTFGSRWFPHVSDAKVLPVLLCKIIRSILFAGFNTSSNMFWRLPCSRESRCHMSMRRIISPTTSTLSFAFPTNWSITYCRSLYAAGFVMFFICAAVNL